MIQLKTPDAMLAPYLPSASDSPEPPATADDRPPAAWAAQADPTERVPFVSPPPMPWPRIFPSL